jgi:NADPH-dependent 2,4-dienoyl-CoA reductase/sulfur reductase-like enzyme
MQPTNRRRFLKLAGATAALSCVPFLSRAAGVAPRVVVIGGGFAGATVAKYLKLWGGQNVHVTLVDQHAAHVSCILSNLVLNDSQNLADITFPLDRLGANHGVEITQARVVDIDPVYRTVLFADGGALPYDRLVLAPGIEFDDLPGLDPERTPHAWRAGPQTLLLKQQLQAMPSKTGSFIMTIPKAPYRCPPGPYERACLVADYLKRRKSGGKVIVLDANAGIMAEPKTFTNAFNVTHAGIIDYRPGVSVSEVAGDGRTLITSAGNLSGDVLNVIPDQKAGQIAFRAGTVAAGMRWARVNPLSYESMLVPGIHVIGDAQATGQPKSGHMANAQAKICADAILRAFNGEAPDPAPMTNSACFSPITSKTASWLTAVYAYEQASGEMRVVPESFGEAASPNSENYIDMFDWAANLFSDTFV